MQKVAEAGLGKLCLFMDKACWGGKVLYYNTLQVLVYGVVSSCW